MGGTEHSAQWLPALLQVSDPLFPTGAYAHSMGLEQWAATCGYRSVDDLVLFLSGHVGGALSRLELPYLRFLIEAIRVEDWGRVWELDAEIDAWKWASEIREASIAQGRGRLRLLKKMWSDSEVVQHYARAFSSGQARGHHLAVCALQFELLHVPMESALMAYAYQNLANYVSASIKLLRISPEAAQMALHQGLEWLPDWVEISKCIEPACVGWFAPAFDLECARHKTAFSRLFIS